MTATLTAADYARKAQEAIAAKDAKAAMEYIDLAKATKAMSQLDTAPRPDYGSGASDGGDAASNMALKSWYSGAFGNDLDADSSKMMNDLYGGDYRALAHAKSAQFLTYLRTGAMGPMAHRVIMTPGQVMKAVAEGQTFSSIKATQVESQDLYGGFLVPEDFHDTVVARIKGATPMRQIATSIQTSRDRVTMPVINGGDDRYVGSVRVVKVDEAPTSTQAATDTQFGSVTIPVYTLMAHSAISKNLLEDTMGAASILSIVQDQFASAYAVFEDEQFLVGNGVGGPQGVLKDATTGGPYTYAYGSVTTVNSGAATAITADGIRALPYGVATQYRNQGGMWLMARGTLRVIKSLKAGDGTYLWSSRGDTPQLQNGAPASLEGFPVMETEVLASPTTGSGSTYTASTYPILFITKPMYQIVDKAVGGMAVERYEDSTTAKQNQVVLVLRRRVGGQVLNPWAGAVMKISA